MLSRKATHYSLFITSFIVYLFIAYKLQRHETILLLELYFLLFGIYSWIIVEANTDRLQFWLYAAFAFRFLLLFSVPNLSDDFYRFVWDGRLLADGHHPFAHVPSFYMENQIFIPGIDEPLFQKLNSKNYFTIYPPFAQFLFWLSAKLSPSIYGSLLVLKISVFSAEIGSILLIRKLLNQLNFNIKNTLIYALNPLVILELTGNVHLEAILIFFLLLSCYLLGRERTVFAALAFAASICVKLVPLIFLPAIPLLLDRNKAILFYGITAIACIVFFLPLWDIDIVVGFQNSLGYYFSRFEFNASIYYIIREIGFLIYGFNVVHIAGGALGVIAGILILRISLSRWPIAHSPWPDAHNKEQLTLNQRLCVLFHTMMWSLLIFFLFTTTLHPWYIATLLMLSVFTNYRFVVLWAGLIFLSYAGYTSAGFEENLWIVIFEYVILLGYLAYEFIWKRKGSYL